MVTVPVQPDVPVEAANVPPLSHIGSLTLVMLRKSSVAPSATTVLLPLVPKASGLVIANVPPSIVQTHLLVCQVKWLKELSKIFSLREGLLFV
jgi:hypothetical protein